MFEHVPLIPLRHSTATASSTRDRLERRALPAGLSLHQYTASPACVRRRRGAACSPMRRTLKPDNLYAEHGERDRDLLTEHRGQLGDRSEGVEVPGF